MLASEIANLEYTGTSVGHHRYGYAIYRKPYQAYGSAYVVRLTIAGGWSAFVLCDTFQAASAQGEAFAHCWRRFAQAL